jgi:hypothetical protein
MIKSEVQNRKTEKFKQYINMGGEKLATGHVLLKTDKTNPLNIILNLHADQVMFVFEVRAGLNGELQV